MKVINGVKKVHFFMKNENRGFAFESPYDADLMEIYGVICFAKEEFWKEIQKKEQEDKEKESCEKCEKNEVPVETK